MPTYHFRCELCREVAEKKLPFGSEAKPDCAVCGKPMQKILVPPAVQFRGDGFYKTDAVKKQESKKSGTKEAPKKADSSPPA